MGVCARASCQKHEPSLWGSRNSCTGFPDLAETTETDGENEEGQVQGCRARGLGTPKGELKTKWCRLLMWAIINRAKGIAQRGIIRSRRGQRRGIIIDFISTFPPCPRVYLHYISICMRSFIHSCNMILSLSLCWTSGLGMQFAAHRPHRAGPHWMQRQHPVIIRNIIPAADSSCHPQDDIIFQNQSDHVQVPGS